MICLQAADASAPTCSGIVGSNEKTDRRRRKLPPVVFWRKKRVADQPCTGPGPGVEYRLLPNRVFLHDILTWYFARDFHMSFSHEILV